MNTGKKKGLDLQDMGVNVKIKLSALWIAVMLCYIYGDIFSLFVPGRIESLMGGQMGLGKTTPIKLLIASIVMTIPALMVFLSLTLKPKANRWTNITLGSIYTVIMIVTIAASMGRWWSFYIFLGIVEIAITLLVVWFAFRWPQQEHPSQ